MLDYRFKVFQAVAEKLNFTRAAENLHISQPAVTQHVKLLEEHYGTPLFRRAAGGIVLTPAGQFLLAAVGRAAELERQTEAQIRSGQALLSGALRVGASTTIAQYFLPAVLGKFQAAHPKVDLTLRIGNTREVADALRAGRLDLGLVEGPSERRDLHATPFFEDEVLCVAAPTHPLALKTKLKAADLAGVNFVLREPGSGTRDVVERALKKACVSMKSLKTVLETDSSETIKGLVAAGAGAAFISRLAITSDLASGRLVIVPVSGLTIRREFYFLYPQGPRPIGVPAVLMDFVIASATTA
jgi:DNA-binding transcriptional LysR family regulator